MDKSFAKDLANYFNSSDAADKIGEKLQSAKGVMPPLAAFIIQRTSESIAAERIAMKMEKQL